MNEQTVERKDTVYTLDIRIGLSKWHFSIAKFLTFL